MLLERQKTLYRAIEKLRTGNGRVGIVAVRREGQRGGREGDGHRPPSRAVAGCSSRFPAEGHGGNPTVGHGLDGVEGPRQAGTTFFVADFAK